MKCPANTVLSRFVDQDLSEHEQVQLQRHLRNCESCFCLFQELSATKEFVASWPRLAVSPNLWAGISRRLGDQSFSIWSWFYQPARRTVPVMVSFLLVIVFFLTFNLLSQSSAAVQKCQGEHLIIEHERITQADVLMWLSQAGPEPGEQD